ncbi:hypothetical protein B0H13DRAFT_2363012 [Mycena leptocephala]|nr:hypothetical protein B0H13DRAFT_2363012 [Mycena leptocephala]
MNLSSETGDGMCFGIEKNPNEKRYLIVSVEEADTSAAVVCGKDDVELLGRRNIDHHILPLMCTVYWYKPETSRLREN